MSQRARAYSRPWDAIFEESWVVQYDFKVMALEAVVKAKPRLQVISSIGTSSASDFSMTRFELTLSDLETAKAIFDESGEGYRQALNDLINNAIILAHEAPDANVAIRAVEGALGMTLDAYTGRC